jgi:hypothetical protein
MESSRPVSSMLQVFAVAVILLGGSALSGCTLCQDCGDLDYPTYGGAWERTRRDSGRVGSVFDPAGARTAKLADRDAEPETEERSPSKTTPESQDAEDASGPDDPKKEGNGSGEPSPSDRQDDAENELRDLDLEDIDADTSELLPPDI